MIVLLTALLGGAVVIAVLLLFMQHSMIYHPRPYEPFDLKNLEPRIARLDFETAAGRQTAFYLRPRTEPGKAPDFLWVAFHGNGSLALDWLDQFEAVDQDRVGFLMIDYPGYGECEGKARPELIKINGEAALNALVAELGVDKSELESSMGTIGFSLGAATALDFAVQHPVSEVIIIAPFTSLSAMARRTVPPPFHLLLLYRHDNEARLRELLGRPNPPGILILHGDADQVIPVAMSRQMSAIDIGKIQYQEFAGADHISVLDVGRRNILDALAAPAN